MPRAAMHSVQWGRASSTPIINRFLIVPISACIYVLIVSPLIYFISRPANNLMPQGDLANRIFWPTMASIAVALAVRNRARLALPPHIICLLVLLTFAGASVLWAFKPEISFVRFLLQVMILTSIVLPILLTDRTTDLMRGVFLCFAFGSILNLLFIASMVFSGYALSADARAGYDGYVGDKNSLGQFAAIALILALHEMLNPGRRRVFGIIVIAIATSLLYLSSSKTAIGLALLIPLIAALTLAVARTIHISPAIALLPIPLVYIVLSSMDVFDIYKLSYLIFGDATFSARTTIWDFALYEIGQRPLLGWGYQSFWLVGLDGPSFVNTRGWVSTMPHAHSGYLDTILQMGYIGFGLLVIFIFATFHAIGRITDQDPARAWGMLSIVLFVTVHNLVESTWMRGSELLWVVFVIVAADIGRYWKPPLIGPAHGPRPLKSARTGLARGVRTRREAGIEVEGISSYSNSKSSGNKGGAGKPEKKYKL